MIGTEFGGVLSRAAQQQQQQPEGWYALRVRSSSELLAARQIAGLGYQPLAPTYRTRRRWSDRMKEVQAPLFPGYIFCRMDPVQRLPVLKCSSVIEVVSSGRIPIEVEPEEIEAVQRIVATNSACAPHPYLRLGQTVELDRGPLKGMSGILLEDKTGLVVSVTLLQRSVRVSIEEAWVDPRCYKAMPSTRVA